MPKESEALQFLTMIVKGIVKSPDEVNIEETQDDKGTLMSIKVAKSDMGNVIGKGGQTAAAIRTILRVFAAKTDQRIAIKVID